jgi:hypothetical protein
MSQSRPRFFSRDVNPLSPSEAKKMQLGDLPSESVAKSPKSTHALSVFCCVVVPPDEVQMHPHKNLSLNQ